MSERSSLVTEYIYNHEDYEIIRKVMESHAICNDRFYYCNDDEIPIICCYVNVVFAANCDWIEVYRWFEGVKTNRDIRFSLIQDGGSTINFVKKANGGVENNYVEG